MLFDFIISLSLMVLILPKRNVTANAKAPINNEKGIKTIGSAIEVMAEAEELFAHKNAVSIRLKEINNV